VQINLPRLSDRREDIPALVDHFLLRIGQDQGKMPKKIDPSALSCLVHHEWQGNVRELENEIRRAYALSSETITVEDLKPEIRTQHLMLPASSMEPGSKYKIILDREIEQVERRLIQGALEETGWKKIEAARLLGVSRPTLDAKIRKYKLEKPSE
jgi:DNA-binding NtrC family response regulator